jgi:archaellum component FlaG (FlaF/FlaG flagellin family)
MGDGPSELIMLTTGLIVAALVSGLLLSTWDTMSQGLEKQGEQEIKNAKTRASLVSDPSAISWDNTADEAFIFVQNSGKISLNIDSTYIFLDGNGMTVTPIDAVGVTWSTGVVVKFKIESLTDLTFAADTPYFLSVGVSSLSYSPVGTHSFTEVVRLDVS